MSDKDDSVEMCEEIAVTECSKDTAIDEVLSSPDNTLSVDKEKAENLDDKILTDNDAKDEMGQLKSKVKNLRGKKDNRVEKDEEEDIEIAAYEGEFMCGVVEGFYGRPWTTGQRKELFRRMKTMGMNTYLYGPKDDYKHRLYWRDLYSDDEAELLKLLMESAAEYDVLFIYAISPGLDMSFASAKELECLTNKLLQVQSLGCKAFAVLFDDIDPLLCAADKAQYSSAASAQASVTNQMHEALGRPRFLFCPTEYCNSMAIPDVLNSKYLETIGKELDKRIPVMWTGPKVVSKYITVEPIKQLTRILRRKVVIWDNIHANDYDPKRMFLGPYKGRSTHLIPHLGGVLTNPNCEFESNYIAMHTLASWWKCYPNETHKPGVTDEMGPKQDEEMGGEANRSRSTSIVMADETSENVNKLDKSSEPSVSKGVETVEEKQIEPIKVEIFQEKNDGTDASDEQKVADSENKGDAIEKLPKEENEQSAIPEDGARNVTPVSSGVSSLAVSDDSDTDSDYSSHDGYYAMSRNLETPFDHGAYDPDEALHDAIRSWLPFFSAARLPLGKPVARSGPPLGMLSHGDVGLMSNAVMGVSSSTTSVLRSDPILSTSIQNLDENPKLKNEKDDPGDLGVRVCEKCEESSKIEDIEMAGVVPDIAPQNIELNIATDSKSDDVKMGTDGDEDSSSSDQKEKKDDVMQMGDVEETMTKKEESATQMETEDEESMQCEPDQDSDVSMATAQSAEEKKLVKEEESNQKQTTQSQPEPIMNTATPLQCSPPLTESPYRQLPHAAQEYSPDGNPSTNTAAQFITEPMTIDDVELAVELFYLPYEHGNFGRKMVKEFLWLQSNIRQAVVPPNAPTSAKNECMDRAMEWMERAIQFEDCCSSIRKVCNKLLSCSNRALLYDLFPYFWDMKGVVSMLSSYVKWMGQFYLRHQPAVPLESQESQSNSSKQASPSSTQVSVAVSQVQPMLPAAMWLGNDPEPWVFRGGLSGEFQRLLPISLANDLFCQAIPCSPPTSTNVYTIRPYLPSDEKAVYNICLTTGNDGTDFADDFTGYDDLPGERLVGGLLALSPEYCFVVEDEFGICGYLVGTVDAKSFWKKYEISFLPDVKERYKKKDDENEEKIGEDVRRLLDEVRSDEAPDAYAVDNLYTSHPAYMQIAVHRRVTDTTIAKSMTVCMLSALKSHNVHGVHTTVRMSDCYMPDLYCRLGFREIRPFGISPPSSPRSCTSNMSKEDSIIVFGRNF